MGEGLKGIRACNSDYHSIIIIITIIIIIIRSSLRYDVLLLVQTYFLAVLITTVALHFTHATHWVRVSD